MNAICTILLISYNHSKYIARAIESVLSQETKYKYIIHIFDDASTDGTINIIKKYKDKFPEKIKTFISETNTGAQSNIWNAYKSVETEYVIVLEGDDYWCDNNKLELQINALEQNPDCIFCATQSKIININDDYRANEDNTLLVVNQVVLNNSIITLDMILNEHCGYINQLTSRVIRISRIDLNKIKYKEAFLYDNCQFFYLLLKGNMYFINKVMSVYQQTGDGNCSGKHPWMRADIHTRALLDLNRETESKIATKIYAEIIFYLRYTFGIAETAETGQTGQTGQTEQTEQIERQENVGKITQKSILSICWKYIYTKPIRKLKKIFL